jgi:hypothetical protein
MRLARRGKPVAVLLSLQEYERLDARRAGLGEAIKPFRRQSDLRNFDVKEIFGGVRDGSPAREVAMRLEHLLDTNVHSEPLRRSRRGACSSGSRSTGGRQPPRRRSGTSYGSVAAAYLRRRSAGCWRRTWVVLQPSLPVLLYDDKIGSAEGRRRRGWLCRTYGRSHKIEARP